MPPLIWARRIELMGSFCNLWKTIRTEKLHSSWFISPNWSKWENECLCWCKTNNWICKVELYTSHKFISGLCLYMKTDRASVCPNLSNQTIHHALYYSSSASVARCHLTQNLICTQSLKVFINWAFEWRLDGFYWQWILSLADLKLITDALMIVGGTPWSYHFSNRYNCN